MRYLNVYQPALKFCLQQFQKGKIITNRLCCDLSNCKNSQMDGENTYVNFLNIFWYVRIMQFIFF